MGEFGAIGEEALAKYGAVIYVEEEDGGVLLPGFTKKHERTLSLRELVATSEPLYDSPRSCRSAFSAPTYVGPLTPTKAHKLWEFVSPPSPSPRIDTPCIQIQRYLGDGACQDFKLPMPKAPRPRTNTVFSSSSDFGQKSYQELLNYANDKIQLVVRKYATIQGEFRSPNKHARQNMAKITEIAAMHLDYRQAAESFIQSTPHMHRSLIVGMIWRLAVDTILDIPLLDQAPTQYAARYLAAWQEEISCGAVESDDWMIKGQLLHQRVWEVRRIIEDVTSPRFNDWIKAFAFDRTNYIVNQLEAAWTVGTKASVCFELQEPIQKLVRMAIRMRGEMKAFEFNFFKHAVTVKSDDMVLHSEHAHQSPPRSIDDTFNYVLCTKVPQVFEKEFRPEVRGKTCIYKAEVVVREKFPGYNAHRRPSPKK